MKYRQHTLISIFLLFWLNLFSQDFKNFNNLINLSNNLEFNNEIRIYRYYDNKISLIRLIEENTSVWKAEFYQENNDTTIDKELLSPKKGFDFVLKNLERNYLYNIPDMNSIRWKFSNRSKVIRNENPNIDSEYTFVASTIEIRNDFEISYYLQAKNSQLENEITFHYPYKYLKTYKDIDELNYYCEILDVITKQFGIWRD